MYLLSWICAGWTTGWLVGKTLKGEGYGPLVDIAMGIGGAVAAGFAMQSAGLSGYSGMVVTTLVAVIGAVFLTLVVGVVNGRRLSVKHL